MFYEKNAVLIKSSLSKEDSFWRRALLKKKKNLGVHFCGLKA
jgi:hypothetical protein